jgi:hypothetical protein
LGLYETLLEREEAYRQKLGQYVEPVLEALNAEALPA